MQLFHAWDQDVTPLITRKTIDTNFSNIRTLSEVVVLSVHPALDRPRAHSINDY